MMSLLVMLWLPLVDAAAMVLACVVGHQRRKGAGNFHEIYDLFGIHPCQGQQLGNVIEG